jgi:hypothetical protein
VGGCAGNQGMFTSPDILSTNARVFKAKIRLRVRKVFRREFSTVEDARARFGRG